MVDWQCHVSIVEWRLDDSVVFSITLNPYRGSKNDQNSPFIKLKKKKKKKKKKKFGTRPMAN
jgi:hypothetical protein